MGCLPVCVEKAGILCYRRALHVLPSGHRRDNFVQKDVFERLKK